MEKSQITTQDDAEDFVPKKPSVKPDKEKKRRNAMKMLKQVPATRLLRRTLKLT